MTIIAIKDLPDSVMLDREAMLAITGGARIGGSQLFPKKSMLHASPISGYPTGFATYVVPIVKQRPVASRQFE
jgi:hypothetical protein